MANYSKWDKLEVSDDEEDKRQESEKQQRLAAHAEEMGKFVEVRDQVETWLKRHLTRMRRELGADPTCPELTAHGTPIRFPSDEERKTLAMFIAVVHHEKLKDNLVRHHDIMNIARQNRWIEEDPGTLELLCRLHRSLIKADSIGQKSTTMEDQKMEDMVISAINILAAPPLCGCKEGYGKVFELFALIGDPKTDEAWDMKAKYMKKEFAGDALFNSMMPPEARLSGGSDFKDAYDMPNGPWTGVISVLLWILLCVFIYLLYWYWPSSSGLAVDDTPVVLAKPAAVKATATAAPETRASEL
uniref:Uncharacterized protein n=1 Tax=Alexandrium catenella TaxID=2925 RepID=A0A7S1PK49_ALECA|mmetsp:Transcript_101803/g.270869  ORF Transcript_101803/g.270869 Transcript_101803/m.270869 type:complete len:301 (+) Transcript_101803:65-967(+)|eukprot:CAMPEP_0171181048 /NCGR_PEP_ID=MMETSP0790-20130122/14064_1 /TAXON_ID=2925 /ORGANISM="Alexandrium catenella, Strain OF101" /LENGTH=300 /DNA_ID=CAMNT_0011645985 /DNA_START=63 /DNA_END=965 /DNA_ORIENTATION=-